jgi:glycosyltransferase involved in cell wall biosynthesis
MHLGIFVTHPVQYHVPIWRELASSSNFDTTVHYFSDQGVASGAQSGFGVPVVWDVPLLEGYKHEFISRKADLSQHRSMRLPRGWIEQRHFDAILIHGYTHGFENQIRRRAASLGAKIIMRGEFGDARPGRSAIHRAARDLYLRWFYTGVDAFCYIGRRARNHLKRFRVGDERLFYSPYTVDSDLFERHYQRADRAASRARLGFSDSTTVFLFSGKLIPRKRVGLILQAVELIGDRTRLALLVVGDGPLAADVIERGEKLLGNRFHFAGFVNQQRLGDFYAAGDVFILPSNYETWGLVVNEAMQFALPCIVSDRVGSSDDLVEEGKTGFVFRNGDAARLAAAMERCLADQAAVRAMGANAREQIRNYTPRHSSEGIVRAVESICARH